MTDGKVAANVHRRPLWLPTSQKPIPLVGGNLGWVPCQGHTQKRLRWSRIWPPILSVVGQPNTSWATGPYFNLSNCSAQSRNNMLHILTDDKNWVFLFVLLRNVFSSWDLTFWWVLPVFAFAHVPMSVYSLSKAGCTLLAKALHFCMVETLFISEM